jgi:signal-transduction protein with cAMP-binding, CBS, and nucleotidyltransferase domain
VVVAEVMSKPAVMVPPGMKVAQVARTMLDKGVRAVVVVEERQMLGIISEMDLLVRNAHLHSRRISASWRISCLSVGIATWTMSCDGCWRSRRERS